VIAQKKGVSILDRGSQVHAMADRKTRETAGAAEGQRRKGSQWAARTTASSAVSKTCVCCTGVEKASGCCTPPT
jgi:hypothetical protein